MCSPIAAVVRQSALQSHSIAGGGGLRAVFTLAHVHRFLDFSGSCLHCISSPHLAAPGDDDLPFPQRGSRLFLEVFGEDKDAYFSIVKLV